MGVRVLLASKPTGLWHPSYVSADSLRFLYTICSWSYTKLHPISSSRQANVRFPSQAAKVSKGAQECQGWPVEAGPATQIDGTRQRVSEAARRPTSLQSHTLTFLIGHGVQGKSQMTGKGQTLHPTTKSAKKKKKRFGKVHMSQPLVSLWKNYGTGSLRSSFQARTRRKPGKANTYLS